MLTARPIWPLLAWALTSQLLPAQGPEVRVADDRWGVKAPDVRQPAPPVDLPPPPRVLFQEPPHHTPPVPIGAPNGMPQPATPPSRETSPDQQQLLTGTGAFTFFRNRVVRPTGASFATSSSVEPSAANNRDVSFQTGNWFAALSTDSGMNWTYVNPYTLFPALDGGFCCDQRVEYVRSHDLLVWQLQYSYSATTQNGSYRLAVANGRDALRDGGTASSWTRYTFDPQDFGLAAGNWMDFPDVSHNDSWFYLSANVYNGASGNYVDTVRWRVSLADMQAGGAASFSYALGSNIGGGASYRFANGGDGTRMYWADTFSSNSLRVWRQDAAGVNTYVDVPIASWTTTTASCVGPDGLDWMSRAVGRIRGACGSSSELIFFWTSDTNGGSRPLPYTRVCRIQESNRALIAEHDVWSASLCWGYAAAEASSLDDIGVVIAAGGPNSIVHTDAFLIDQYQAWGSVTATVMASGAVGPAGNRWGDYLDVQRSWHDQRTFVGTGMDIAGTAAARTVQPRYAWFGRNDYEPIWVNLSVNSTPVSGIAISVDTADRNNLSDGSTNFVRSYTPRQAYQLTAPASFVSGATTYVFDRWELNTAAQPLDQLVLAVNDIGTVDDTAEAQYKIRRTLTVQSTNPGTGVSITVSPSDINGNGNGTTTFTRFYKDGQVTTLTAPAAVGANPFKRWRLDGVNQALGVVTLNVTMGANHTAVADYYIHTAGSFAAGGAGCAGSNGLDTIAAAGTPEIGQSPTYRLTGGRPNSAAILALGLSNSSWLGVPLPLAIPGAAGCSLSVSLDVTFGTATNGLGIALQSVAIPNDVSLIGGHFYTQYLCVDPGANSTNLTFSGFIDTLVGGDR